MSKLRLAVGILALVFVISAGMAVAMAYQQERNGHRARPEYTVATASAGAQSPAAAGSSLLVPSPRGFLGTLPDSLTLVLVGGFLLGLAAAVRRTT